ncbi:MAG: 1-(5-phosphoribosyl)-5-((5-phosphoribosylamino)methylideneamino)imidazole-4-carboxamide isomerase, partial [Ruminococcaceae bacterium]|nr:1-(5-phosphoribosyl)-5-((5-phosphoribosylamino)methylideneamino)imidazole-4-carboxamide isomerase [Oscillospiraceae bacterium]
MKLFPAIDMIGGKAVRLVRGDYAQMTVYSDDPVSVARSFAEAGATCMHMVDLEGARDGGCPNLDTIRRIVQDTELFVEVGGGIRDAKTVETYLSAGVGRVILGTAAVTNPAFLDDMLRQHGERIAVGVDIRDGYVAIKGWTELSEMTCFDFCADLERRGVRTVICTDISKDGLLGGTNTELYADMS